MTYYLVVKGELYEIDATSPRDARKQYCEAFGLNKTPGGSGVSLDRDSFKRSGPPKPLPRAV